MHSANAEVETSVAEGMRRAGLRDHLDERADFHIASGGYLRDAVNTPTPTEVPGGTTIDTEQLVQLLPGKPLILTTTADNPTIPGAILVNLQTTGTLTDQWQVALGKLVSLATGGDKQRPIATFAWSVNRWPARNLALRLITLGYTNVYWYRGGWEAWDAHDLPKAPLAGQFLPPH